MSLKKWLGFLALISGLPVFAQTTEGKNMVKLNFSSLAFKGFNVQYERQVSQKMTVALSYGMIPFSTIPYKSYIKNEVFIPDVNLSDFNLGTSIFTPEVRYYFGKKGAFHGFYIAPYARISSYRIKGPISYSAASGAKEDADFEGKLKTITGGIMIGSSWHISDKLYIDWWIAGASIGGENGKYTASLQLSSQDQASLKKTLDSISLSGITLQSEVNADSAIIRSSGTMLGLRGFGLNLGFRF
jgi:hypothetical protein